MATTEQLSPQTVDDHDFSATFDAVTGAPDSDFPTELSLMMYDCIGGLSFLQSETVDGETEYYDPFERMEIYADATVPSWREDGKCVVDAQFCDRFLAELDNYYGTGLPQVTLLSPLCFTR